MTNMVPLQFYPFIWTDSRQMLDDLGVEAGEHRAFRECIQFDGDECRTCDELSDRMAEAKDAIVLETIALYNERYADYITRRAALYATGNGSTRINDVDLLNAHDHAAFRDCPPPDGWVQAPYVHPAGRCCRCDGTGKVSSPLDNGRCWRCLGSGHCQHPEGN